MINLGRLYNSPRNSCGLLESTTLSILKSSLTFPPSSQSSQTSSYIPTTIPRPFFEQEACNLNLELPQIVNGCVVGDVGYPLELATSCLLCSFLESLLSFTKANVDIVKTTANINIKDILVFIYIYIYMKTIILDLAFILGSIYLIVLCLHLRVISLL